MGVDFYRKDELFEESYLDVDFSLSAGSAAAKIYARVRNNVG